LLLVNLSPFISLHNSRFHY